MLHDRTMIRHASRSGTVTAISLGVHGAAAIVDQRLAQRRTGDAEGNGVDHFSIARAESCPDMVLADRIDVSERMRRQRQHRFGIAGAEGTGPR